MVEEDLSYAIRGIILSVHRDYGPGLFESVYERVLAKRLVDEGFAVRSQVPIYIPEPGLSDVLAFKIDLLVEDRIIIELKSVAKILPVHRMQLNSYLRLTNLKLGLLINFNVAMILQEGVTRIVNERSE